MLNTNELGTNRKEYARLSMAIKKAKERGEDYTTLLAERDKLLSGRTKPRNLTNLSDKPIDKTDKDKTLNAKYDKLINDKELIEQSQLTNQLLQQIINLLDDKKEPSASLTLTEQSTKNEGVTPYSQPWQTESNVDLKKEISELIKTEMKNLREELLAQLTKKESTPIIKAEVKEPTVIKPITPKRTQPQSISQPTNNASSPMKETTLRFNQEVCQQVQSFLNQSSLFVSFSHFFREALMAYQNGSLNWKEQVLSESKNIKRNIRLDAELEALYRQLPEGQKSQILSQILASFLEKQS